MSSFIRSLLVAFAVVEGTARAALAMGGGGPPVSAMTQNYCRETVYNRGITGATKFEQEVRKCVANPVTYPTASK